MITCPKCLSESGEIIEEISREDERASHIPEGLDGYSEVRCASCLYEWHIVTHRQIVQSLRLWNSHPGGLTP